MEKFWAKTLLSLTQILAPSNLIITLDEDCMKNQNLTNKDILGLFSNSSPKSSTDSNSKNSPLSRHDILIANHQIYVDWVYIWSFLDKINRSGDVKIVMKRSLQFVPLFGWV